MGVLSLSQIDGAIENGSTQSYDHRPPRPLQSRDGFRRVFTGYLIGIRFFHQARSAVRCSASRMKGELHPTKERL